MEREVNMQESKFTGGLLGLIGINLITSFITMITLGLAYPWAICIKENWIVNHSIIDGKKLYFDGKGSQLFGNYIKWFLLTLITLGIYGFWLSLKMRNWKTKHTHIV